MFEKQAEEYRKDLKSKFFLSEPQLDLACQGFKDGLIKANGWHNLKKNPNDLPKEYDIVRKAFGVWEEEKYYHIVLDQNGEKVYCMRQAFDKSKAWCWFHVEDDKGAVEYEVTAWCEVPTFKDSDL